MSQHITCANSPPRLTVQFYPTTESHHVYPNLPHKDDEDNETSQIHPAHVTPLGTAYETAECGVMTALETPQLIMSAPNKHSPIGGSSPTIFSTKPMEFTPHPPTDSTSGKNIHSEQESVLESYVTSSTVKPRELTSIEQAALAAPAGLLSYIKTDNNFLNFKAFLYTFFHRQANWLVEKKNA